MNITRMNQFQRLVIGCGLVLMCLVGACPAKTVIRRDGTPTNRHERTFLWQDSVENQGVSTDFRRLVTEWAIIAFATAAAVIFGSLFRPINDNAHVGNESSLRNPVGLTPDQKSRFQKVWFDYQKSILAILTMILGLFALGELGQFFTPKLDAMSRQQSSIIWHGIEKGLIIFIIGCVITAINYLPKTTSKRAKRVQGSKQIAGQEADHED